MSELLQYSLGRQSRRVVLVLALAFLFVPYLVDVVYLGDLTPTHFAQELATEDKDSEITFDTGWLSTSVAADNSYLYEHSLVICPPRNVVIILSNAKIFPLQYLDSASLISRPPPSTHLS
jgi:hypothetical protein